MNSETFERIEAYLANRLTAEERTAFEQEISENSELAEAVALQRLERRAMQLALHDELRQTMQAWRAEEASPQQEAVVRPLRVRFRRTLAAAASVLVLVLAGTSWWATQQYSNEALALDANAAPRISRNRGATDQLTQAQAAVNRGEYQQVLDLLENDTTTNAVLLRGAAYFGLGNAQEARAAYEAVLDSGSTPQQELAEWQLILLELADGQVEVIQPKLQAIIDQQPPHTYQQQARELQEKLGSFWRRLAW